MAVAWRFRSPGLIPLGFSFWCWHEVEVAAQSEAANEGSSFYSAQSNTLLDTKHIQWEYLM